MLGIIPQTSWRGARAGSIIRIRSMASVLLAATSEDHMITSGPQLTNPLLREYLRYCELSALTQLREVVPKDASTWCTPKELLTTGNPYEEILRVARDEDVHLIVMGVCGRNPIDLMFFGSTTNHVVRAATCPVLTLKG